MKRVAIGDARAQLSRYVSACRSGPVVITRKGKAVAMLLSVPEDQGAEGAVKLSEILDAARARFRALKGVPHDEFWRRIDERYGDNDKPKKKPRA